MMSPLKKTVKKSAATQTSGPAAKRALPKTSAKKPKAPVKQALKKSPPKKTAPLKADTTRRRPTPKNRQTDDRYRMILEETDLGYGELDLGGNFTFVNEAGARKLGYAPQDMIGKNYRAYTDEDAAQKLGEIYKTIFETGKPVKGVEVAFLHKDGTRRIKEMSAALTRDDSGEPAGFRGISRDVTERKLADAELKLSEARLQSLFDISQFKVKDVVGLLDYALEHAISLTRSKIGFICHYSEDLKQFQLNTWSKDVMKECSVSGSPHIFELDHTGIWGEAVRQCKPIVINNYRSRSPMKKGIPKGHVALSRVATIPVFRADQIVAVVCVGNKETDYNEADVRQLNLLMDAVWKALGRWQMEEALKKSEERYRTILEEIEEGYVEIDLEGNMIFVNEAAAKNIGYTPQELAGTNISRYLREGDTEQFLRLYLDICRTGQRVRRMEVPLITKLKTTRYFELSGALIRDAEGTPTGFRGITRDVTERKWMDEALLQSEARYLSIIESIGQAYFETDLRGGMTFFNDKVSIDLGYTRDELLRKSHRDLQDAGNAQKTQSVFKKVYETGISNPAYIYEAIRKDGNKVVFEMSISLMHDAEGNPIGFRGLSRDITTRKEMEDALRASEERARTIIATIPDPYFETDLKGKITYINQAFQSLLGYTLVELGQMDSQVYLDPQNADVVFTLYDTVYKTGLTMKNTELRVQNRNGENRIVNLSVSLIVNPQGLATGFHGIIRDVTEKKTAEALIYESEKILREYSESLEERVSERTAALEKAKVAAEAASHAKSDFLANISHEFQTPLNAVIGFTKVLKDRLFGELNDKQEEFVRYISDAGENLSRLLTSITDVSSVATGRTRLNLSAVSIPQALSKTIQLLDKQLKEKQQVLTVNVALDADVSIEADAEKVRHIFFHLLSNAVKYSPESGKICIEAQRMKNAAGEEGVAVAFADNGPGIKPDNIPRLFQNFGRLESTYARETSGIGVGLSLTRQLTELHGGSVSVESEYGRGSTFTVFLPLKQNNAGLRE